MEASKEKITRVHASPFKLSRVQDDCVVHLRKDTTICIKPVAKVVEGKPGMTIPDFSDQVSVQKLIDSYKDETGLAYALRQINNGRLMPSQLMDKGDKGADVSEIPDNVNDAYRLSQATSAEAKKVADALGVTKLDQNNLDAQIAAIVEQKFKSLIESQNKEVKPNE